MKAELKTKQNDQSVEEFLNGITDEEKRKDSFAILELMKRISNDTPKMWGDSIVGLGTYHYKYESGREGDWFNIGFSPRKQALTLYLFAGFDSIQSLLDKLGKHTVGKGCLYIKRLADIDIGILESIIRQRYEALRSMHS